jgi:nucleotidyltransferase substrate binding protein (TIGR01987 family)
MNEILDLNAFSKAVASFSKALDEYAKDESNEFVRDACIQRFEYCYDLSTRMIRRHLKNIVADPSEIDQMSFKKVISEAYSKGILQHSWDVWAEYREDRNTTFYSYNEELAMSLVLELDNPYQEILFLLTRLKNLYEV